MAKRKTRKQKENVHHPFTLSWNPDSQPQSSSKYVKGKKILATKSNILNSKTFKKTKHTVEPILLKSIKKDILKSVIVASLILFAEVMIYFF